MTAQTMKRTFLRTNRYGMLRQADEKRMFGPGRNSRHPEGQTIVTANMIYRRKARQMDH